MQRELHHILTGGGWLRICIGKSPFADNVDCGCQTMTHTGSVQMANITRNRAPEIITPIVLSSTWGLSVSYMMTIEQHGSSDVRIVTGSIESDIKLGRLNKWLLLTKWLENKYRMECRRDVGIIPGCWYDSIEYSDDRNCVSKHCWETTGSKWVRWRYGSKLASFLTWKEPHDHQNERYDPLMGIIVSLDSWQHVGDRTGPVVQLM